MTENDAIFEFDGCIDVTFNRLDSLINTVDIKYMRFYNIVSENAIAISSTRISSIIACVRACGVKNWNSRGSQSVSYASTYLLCKQLLCKNYYKKNKE